MQRLFHFSTIPKYIEWFEDDWEQVRAFINKHQLDGIELGLTKDYPIEKIPEDLVKGVHLSFYPMWLEFWKEDLGLLETLLGSKEAILNYYGTEEKQVFIDNYKREYQRAKALKADYMVFHVSHIRPEDSFTWTYSYTDKEVIDASIALINAIFEEDPDGPMLLLENLWWPGLNYMDTALTKYLLDNITYKRKGLVLDTSHLILTNGKIGTEKAASEYIQKVVKDLGPVADAIQTVHLNKTLPKYYMSRNHSYTLEKYQKAKDFGQKTGILKDHVRKLDVHQPFNHPEAKCIVEAIKPSYCVFETNPSAKHELSYFVKQQNSALGINY